MQDAAERKTADIGRGVQVRDERLERMVGIVGRRRNGLEERVEERAEVRLERVGREPRVPRLRVAVDDRKLDLRLRCVEVEEELIDLVHNLLRAGVGPVDLVDDEDDRESRFERLPEHETRLRQRPFARIDEQEDTVDHGQAALHFAAEVGMAGRVDDVHLRLADRHGRVLGQDRDALLALEVGRVHDPLGHVLVRPEGAGLPEHRVDERRFAVVDVRHDGDIAEIVPLCGEGRARHSRP